MSILLWIVLLLLLLLHGYREYWCRRDLPQIHKGEFDGALMKVGSTFIARRPAKNGSTRTLICFPGFLEDMRYFQDVYKDSDAELILLNNANYHCPFSMDDITELDWPKNPYTLGTIEHDAFYMGNALERLASGHEICLHGHSRGGAVVLETGRQFPELTNSKTRLVRALLEAAVLPQARTVGNGSEPLPHKLQCYFIPIYFGLSRNISAEKLLKLPMMRPTTTLKTDLCLSVFSVSRSYATCVANVRSIFAWQRSTQFDVYENYKFLTVVLGERDTTLDLKSMKASALQGQQRNSGLSILQTEGTNHFVSLERPELIRAIH
ncbi:alpha/beta hydrolase [Zhongshania sp.]|jgi:pimeloyl-ACP methyl ester carboxylesterase|uniref:alpha/beta hydrolase n=1 Tax=Zhongshania sp. TaxID=1971902 RepID=UPI0039E63705